MNVMLIGYLGFVLTTTERQSTFVYCGYKLYDVDAPFSSGLTAIINATREEVECKNSEYNIINAVRVPVNNNNQPCFIQKDFEWNKVNLPLYSVASQDCGALLPSSMAVTLTTMYNGLVTAISTNAGVAVLNGQAAVSLVTERNAVISNFAMYNGKPRVGVVYNKNSFGDLITKNMQYYALVRCVEQFKLLTYFKNKVNQNSVVEMSADCRATVDQRMVEAANIGKALQKNELVDLNRLHNFTAITDNFIAVCNQTLRDLRMRLRGNQATGTNTAEKAVNAPVSVQPVENVKTTANVPVSKPVETKVVAPANEGSQPSKSDTHPVAPEAIKEDVKESIPTPTETMIGVNESTSSSASAVAETPVSPKSKMPFVLTQIVPTTDIAEDDDIEPVADLLGTEYEAQVVLSHAYTSGGATAGGICERDFERDKLPAALTVIGHQIDRDTIVSIDTSTEVLYSYLTSLTSKTLPGSPAFWQRAEGCYFMGEASVQMITAMRLAKLIETKTIRGIDGKTYEILNEFCPLKVELAAELDPTKVPFSVVVGELRSPAGHTLTYNTLDYRSNGVSMTTQNIQQLSQLMNSTLVMGAAMKGGKVHYSSHYSYTLPSGEEITPPVYKTGVLFNDVDSPIVIRKQSEKPTYSTYGRRDQFGNIKILRDDEIDDGYIRSLTTLDLEYIYNWLNINVFATAAGGCAPSIRLFAMNVVSSGGSYDSYECMYVCYEPSEADAKSVFEMSSTNTGEVSKRIGGDTYVVRPVAVGIDLDKLAYSHAHSISRGGSSYTSFYSAFILMMLYISGYNLPTWLKDFNSKSSIIKSDFPDLSKARKGDLLSLYMNCVQRMQNVLGTCVPTTTYGFATATFTLGYKWMGLISGDYNTGMLSSICLGAVSSKSSYFYHPKLSENSISKRLQLSADLFRISEMHSDRVTTILRMFAMLSQQESATFDRNSKVLGKWFKEHSIFNIRDFGVMALSPAVVLQQRTNYVGKLEKQARDAMWDGFLEDGYKLTGKDITSFVDMISTTKNLDNYSSLSSIPSDITTNLCYDSNALNKSTTTNLNGIRIHDIVTNQQAGYGLWLGLLRSGGVFMDTLIKLCRQYPDYNVMNGVLPLAIKSVDTVNEFNLTGDSDVASNTEDRVRSYAKRWLASIVVIRAIYTSNENTIPRELMDLYTSIHIPFNTPVDDLMAIPEIRDNLQRNAKFNLNFMLQSDTVEYAKLFKLLIGISVLRHFPQFDSKLYDRYSGNNAGIAAFFVRHKQSYDSHLYMYDADIEDDISTYYLFECMQRIWIILGLQFGDFAGVWDSKAVREYNSQSVNLVISLCDLFERIRVMDIDLSNLSKTDFYLSFFGRFGYLTFAILVSSVCNINNLPSDYWALLNKPSLQELSKLESKYHDIFVMLGRADV